MDTCQQKKFFVRLFLYCLYLASIAVMLLDFRNKKSEAHLFYVLCNGALVFRLLGRWFFPWVLHLACFGYVVYFLVTLKWEETNTFNSTSILVPLILQAASGLHFVFFRPGRTVSQRACRVGVHAHLGLMVIVVYYWVCCYLVKFDDYECLCEMIYLMIFLVMMLIPQFMTKGQAVAQARCERIKAARRTLQLELEREEMMQYEPDRYYRN